MRIRSGKYFSRFIQIYEVFLMVFLHFWSLEEKSLTEKN